jgi:hypothetical protein
MSAFTLKQHTAEQKDYSRNDAGSPAFLRPPSSQCASPGVDARRAIASAQPAATYVYVADAASLLVQVLVSR